MGEKSTKNITNKQRRTCARYTKNSDNYCS